MSKEKSERGKENGTSSIGNDSEAQLRAAEHQFRLLVESVREYAIYMLDSLGRVVTWNAGAERIKGYNASEIIGKNFSCFYTADDVAAGKPQRNLERATKEGQIREQGLRVRKDGSTFPAEVLLTAVRDEAGNLCGFSKITRDVTEQVRARSAEAARAAAEKANKAKDEFLAALSHELRTPLTPALVAASYLADQTDKLPLEFSEDLDTIRRNIQLEARLIDDLLDLTRISRGKIELHFDRVDAHSVIGEALDIAQEGMAEKSLQVETSLDATEHHIWGDRIRVEQVFWNLINNAVKFTPRGGRITIRTSNDERNHFQFEISDSGIGIERDRQSSLFKPFEQADASVTRQFGGLGLGLAISKHLVELHDGAINVHSDGRNKGTTFKVTFDVMPTQVGESGVRTRVPHKPAKSLRILLVEDHGDTRRTLERLLSHFGHEIATAETTASALRFVQSQNFDVVLSDIGLPDGSGYDVISRAKQTQRVKGVALTGFGNDDDIRRGKEAGFDYHLVKPIDFHELRSVLEQVGA